ncbi:DUF2514 family protein [Eoetvoesiella caeni]|uniref:Uncharacterized protein DUF2514 n=1 Tax=Eoetvoesiella caeni TaxID=645616 RepID=A0A366HDB7_9BURK|nr:DUF2514 family protein [Eoetvoesiella caeni]MCI2809403.1 DUF2514 domain-containing protein [Eoetvoesiella caeni]NYT54544.1 DUF2514 family protein [Eoetvoesiella caeni]RBP39266.1 uncharacterized protein DUF2514 [Eoetvoesiella caeni]
MPIRSQLIAAAVGLALAFGSGWMVQGWRYTAEIAQIRTDQATALANAQAKARKTEHAYQNVLEGVVHDADAKVAAAAIDAAAARDNAGRLRAQLTRLSRSPRNTTTAGSGPATGDPIGVLAVVLSEVSDRSTELAGFGDQSRIAGLACEAAYDGVRAAK